jgi:histone-lysine N-methyltransferase SETMAR
MFAASREQAISFVGLRCGFKRLCSPFFTYTTLIVSETLRKGRKFNQYYFISTVLPELVKEKWRLLRRKQGLPFLIHMDNSAHHNGYKITDKLTTAYITLAPHPPYSSDLSPCNFWLFGFLKESMKGTELSTEDQVAEGITTIWRGVTLTRCNTCSNNGCND